MVRDSDTASRDNSDQSSSADVDRAIRKLTSLRDGELGVIDVVACGPRAIPALRAILITREPSGLYESRRLAVDALALLHASDALIDFLKLSLRREIADPVERTGEDAVINATARSLATSTVPLLVPLLLELAQQRPLAGVIETLGKSCRIEALPHFIAALAEDSARPAAEVAIRYLGQHARPLLRETLARPLLSHGPETVSSGRRRRSALMLLGELRPIAKQDFLLIRRLVHDENAEIAALSSELCLTGDEDELAKISAVHRLIDLLGHADWLLAEQIEDCLAKHLEFSKTLIAEKLRQCDMSSNVMFDVKVAEGLLRVLRSAARASRSRRW